MALVAPSVRNAGEIEARLGKVLGSGHAFTVDLVGTDPADTNNALEMDKCNLKEQAKASDTNASG